MKREEVQQLSERILEDLGRQLDAGKSEEWRRYLAAFARFHDYSFGNVLLIVSQRPDAKQVAGVRTWNSLGRHVRKGEKGIGIFAPMAVKDREAAEGGDEERKRLLFRVVHVFDVSQTEGEPLPELPTVKGDPREYLERLKNFAAEKGIVIEHRDNLGGARGVSCKGKVLILSSLTPAEEFSTLSHEIAHEMLHTERREFDRKRAELEAYVVATFAGLDVGTKHADYILGYDGDRKKLAESLDRIQKTAAEIIGGVTAEKPVELAA